MGTMKADWQCKLIIIGDTGVGKTCVMRRFTDNEFSYNFVATIGIDFKIRMVRIGDKAIKVQIWDTAGQEKFRSITTAYYRGAKGVLIVYDITNEVSFQNVTKWVKSFRRWAGSEVESMLIGNKCDAEDGRQVQRRDGEKLAKDHGMFFTETSAKENINVETAFMEILTVIVDKHRQQIIERQAEVDGQAVHLNGSSNQQSGGGCCKK